MGKTPVMIPIRTVMLHVHVGSALRVWALGEGVFSDGVPRPVLGRI